MRAIVLLGGMGTRLRPITDEVPKQLLPVVDRPLLDWVVGHLRDHGVDEVVLSLGYQPDAFLAAYPDGMCSGVPITYAIEPEPRYTAGGVAYAADEAGIDDTFIVVNGDVMNDLDLSALVAFHRERGAEGTVARAPVDDPSEMGVAVLDDEGRVEMFVEKPKPGEAPSSFVNAGTYVLEPTILDRIDRTQPSNINRITFPAMVDDQSLFGLELDGWWIDVGTVSRYLEANAAVLRRSGRASYVAEGAEVAADAVIHGSVVAAGGRVEAGATVCDAVVLAGGVVASGETLADAVAMAGGLVVSA